MPSAPVNATAISISVGDAVRLLRVRRAWTQAELAERAAVSRVTVLNLERNPDSVSRDTTERIAAALGITVLDLEQVAISATPANHHDSEAFEMSKPYELQLLGILRSLPRARQRQLCTLASDFAAGRIEGDGSPVRRALPRRKKRTG